MTTDVETRSNLITTTLGFVLIGAGIAGFSCSEPIVAPDAMVETAFSHHSFEVLDDGAFAELQDEDAPDVDLDARLP